MKNRKILLVEDAADVQMLVKKALAKNFEVTVVTTAEAAQRELSLNTYALMLLDVGLPGEDGFKFCADLRADEKFRHMPIVFLTGKTDTRDKVMGFSLGADDYIVKPLDLPEFQARIEAKMRRLQDTEQSQNFFFSGPIKVNLAEQKVFVDSRDLGLTTIEFKLLYFLLRNENQALSRDQILNEVWGANIAVTGRVVDNSVYTLRTKLGPLAHIVQSVPKVGYRLSHSDKTRAA